MERGFVEPTDLPGVPRTPPSQGSRQSQHSGQGSERGTGRPGNVRNQTGQDNPFQAATGTPRFTCTCSTMAVSTATTAPVSWFGT